LMRSTAFIVCLVLLCGGCATDSKTDESRSPFVGTWKSNDVMLRFYPNGNVMRWKVVGVDSVAPYNWGTAVGKFSGNHIVFEDWDGNLVMRDGALVVQTDPGGEEVYSRLVNDRNAPVADVPVPVRSEAYH